MPQITSVGKIKKEISFCAVSNKDVSNEQIRRRIIEIIKEILSDGWGAFPEDFIKHHIIDAARLILAIHNGIPIGFASMTLRKINGVTIHYLEFVIVKRKFQNYGIGSQLAFRIIKKEIIKNLYKILLGRSLEIFFITPNIRVLSRATKYTSFIYPNPFNCNVHGKIEQADDETWEIALEILKTSEKPKRKLDREGLVLHGSYTEMPQLIYNNDNAPWHYSEDINNFAKRYLGYSSGEDKEFMVRAKINFLSLLLFFLK